MLTQTSDTNLTPKWDLCLLSKRTCRQSNWGVEEAMEQQKADPISHVQGLPARQMSLFIYLADNHANRLGQQIKLMLSFHFLVSNCVTN